MRRPIVAGLRAERRHHFERGVHGRWRVAFHKRQDLQHRLDLANLAAGTLDRLATLVRTRRKQLQYRPGVLDGLFPETGLEFDLPPPRPDKPKSVTTTVTGVPAPKFWARLTPTTVLPRCARSSACGSLPKARTLPRLDASFGTRIRTRPLQARIVLVRRANAWALIARQLR